MATHFAIDLLSPRPPASRWAVPLALVGLCCFVGAAGLLAREWHEREALRSALSRASVSNAEVDAGPNGRRAQAGAPTAAPTRDAVELRRIAGDLQRPWLPLFDALEARASADVRVVQVVVDGGFERVQLQVQARELATLLRYVRTLDAAGFPLRGAQLLSHEWLGGPLPGAGLDKGAAGSSVPRHLVARIALPLQAGVPSAAAPVAPGQPAREPAWPAAAMPASDRAPERAALSAADLRGPP